jgi:hypothetical protein
MESDLLMRHGFRPSLQNPSRPTDRRKGDVRYALIAEAFVGKVAPLFLPILYVYIG